MMQVLYYFTKTQQIQHFAAPSIELGIIMELGDRSLEDDINLRKKKEKYYTLD